MPQTTEVPALEPTLLPTFQEYKAVHASWIAGFDFWDYLNMRDGNFDLAAAYSKLFWPNFVELEGCVLLARQADPESVREWITDSKGNTRAAEAMLNHLLIADLFPGRTMGISSKKRGKVGKCPRYAEYSGTKRA